MRKKKINKKIERPERKPRAKHSPPEELTELIEWANSVSPETVLPDSFEVWKKHLATLPNEERWYPLAAFLKGTISEDERQQMEEQLNEKQCRVNEKIFLECFQDFSKEDQRRILHLHASQIDLDLEKENFEFQLILLYRVLKWHDKVRLARQNFRTIIDFVAGLKGREPGPFDQLPALESRHGILRLEDELRIAPTSITGIVSSIDITRLRNCEICKRFFWASYKNMTTCSQSCRNTLRQRTYRGKKKEEINANRRKKYQRKKEEINEERLNNHFQSRVKK